MANIYRFAALIFIIGLMATFLGCAAKRTDEIGGRYIDTSATTTKVKATIFNADMLKTFQIGVENSKDEIQRRGFVNSPEEVTRAGKVARNFDGVVSVNNNLIVK